MDLPARQTQPYDICCFGARFLLERHGLTGLTLLLTLVSLTIVKLAVSAKESRNTCEEIQMLQGVENATVSIGRMFSYPIPPFAFQGKITYYKITLANGAALPKWLTYNHNINTLQGLPMPEESGEYYLTIFAYGEACGQKTPTANATFALHVQDDILIYENEIAWNKKQEIICYGAPCLGDLSVVFAEIIIEAASFLKIRERLFLICTMAEYLHLDPFWLTLAPFKRQFRNLTILAEDIRDTRTTKRHYFGLYWPVRVGVFTMLYELVQILRHNVESNSLSQVLGYEIAGWRVLKKEGNEKKLLRKRHRRHLMATPRPALRPIKMDDFTYLSATVPEMQSFLSPSENPSPLYEASKVAVHTQLVIFFHSATNEMNLETMETQVSLDFQDKTPASNVSHYLSSELSPSLTSTTMGFVDVVSKTPTISEHQQFQVSQAVNPTPKTSNQKHNSTLYSLVFSIPVRKIQLSVGISPEVILSTKPPLAHLGETTTTRLVYSGPYRQLTLSVLPSQSTTFTTKHSLPFMSVPMDLGPSPKFQFFSTAMSVLLSHVSYQTTDDFSHYKYASRAFMSFTTPFTILQTEVTRWNIDFSLSEIMSTSDATANSSASFPFLGLLPDACPTVQLYYTKNILSSPTYTILDLSFLEFGVLSRTSNIPAFFLSFFSLTPMELTASVRYGNTFPVEEPLSLGTQDDYEITEIYSHALDISITASQTYRHFVTEDKTTTIIMSHTDASLEKEQPHFIYITESSTTPLRIRLLDEAFSHGLKWTSDQYSYKALLLSQPAAFSITPNNGLPTNDVGFPDNSIIKTYLGVLQLEPSHLSLDGSFGTKINFQMTGKLLSKVMQQSVIPPNNKKPTETGVHATTSYHGPQDTPILMPTLHRSPQGTGEIRTPFLSVSHITSIGETNNSPRVANAIKWITATIGHRFSFSVPPNTFYDEEDGNTTQLTLGINPTDGSPTGPECWLQFNSSYQTMYGYPLDDDFQYSPQEFLIFATDSGGLRTSDALTIEMLRPTTTPCHVYTVKTKNSYHSFLRNREKINLFFEKLSKYVSVGSPGNMVLLHLEPGSTVVAWYSKSFCTRTNKCARDEIQDVLMKLGIPGINVSPNFLEAMLPDFKVYHLGDVAYGGTCSSTATPLNETLTSNRTLSVFKDSHSWVENIFSVLLISMCTSIIAILIVVIHCCKHHKKIFHSDSASVHGRPFLSYIDLEMDVLKSHKPPILDQEVPPSAQLWLPASLQQNLYRPNRRLGPSGIPPPPKYRLPPSYGMEETSQIHCDHSHRKNYP